MSVKVDKAFLKYYDENGFGKKSSEEVRIAKLAFVAGYEAAEKSQTDDVSEPVCKHEISLNCVCEACSCPSCGADQGECFIWCPRGD